MSFIPVFSAAVTTLSNGVRLISAVPLFHHWSTFGEGPAPSPPYCGRPPGVVVRLRSLKPQVRKTFRPAFFPAARPFSTSAGSYWWSEPIGKALLEETYIVEWKVIGIGSREVEVFAIELEGSALCGNKSFSERSGSRAGGKQGGNSDVATHLVSYND